MAKWQEGEPPADGWYLIYVPRYDLVMEGFFHHHRWMQTRYSVEKLTGIMWRPMPGKPRIAKPKVEPQQKDHATGQKPSLKGRRPKQIGVQRKAD